MNKIVPTLILSLVSSCSQINYPVWLGDKGLEDMCHKDGVYTYTHQSVTKEFDVHLVSRTEIINKCNNDYAVACILGNTRIYVTPGRNCTKALAHELSHGFNYKFAPK